MYKSVKGAGRTVKDRGEMEKKSRKEAESIEKET